ncbi:MAG: 1-acyl-sn-glycerol-3-phosphate acyltransferase [Rhodobacteraceae bacterium]|jgi:1-acyl-sn-glycerol-3-phosphate acyltransferase|nr:1-acyl-sn-glycerol-3-phosphate acyltransferase [Paracoccaceae bacterium]
MPEVLRASLARLVGAAIVLFAWLMTAVRGVWQGVAPDAGPQRVYFANHTSNGDFVLVWAVLPPHLRRQTRPVAGSDYWLTTPIRRFIGRDVFRAVLIDRRPDARTEDPMAVMVAALDTGASLILFPEGTRNMTDAALLPFKSGLYNLSVARPGVDLVPTWIENLNHVMPKGKIVPVPLLCTVTFGAPIRAEPGEDRHAFLDRARTALLALAPERPTP